MPQWLSELERSINRWRMHVPTVPSPAPNYPVVTNHGPGVDSLINELPTAEREAIRRHGVRVSPADRMFGGAIGSVSPFGGGLTLSDAALDSPSELPGVLAHEARHLTQRDTHGLPAMAFRQLRDAVRAWEDRPDEVDAMDFENRFLADRARRLRRTTTRPAR